MGTFVIAATRSIQPGRQQSLTTAEIQDPLRARQQSLPENSGKRRIAPQFAAGFEVSKKIRLPVPRTGRFAQGLSRRTLSHVSTERKVTGVSLAAATACSTLGNTSNITGNPDGVRAAWPSWSSRISPPLSPSVRRLYTTAGSALTVSNPRRVQLANRKPRGASTGSRKGLRSPAGARKQRGR